MIETSSRTYQALTSIAADQAKKLLDLAGTEWSACQRYAAVTIPEDMRDVYPTVIYIRSSVITPEFELRREAHINCATLRAFSAKVAWRT